MLFDNNNHKTEHNEHAVYTKIIVKLQNPVFVQIPWKVLIIVFTTIPKVVQNVAITLPTESASLCIMIITHTSTVPNLFISIHTSPQDPTKNSHTRKYTKFVSYGDSRRVEKYAFVHTAGVNNLYECKTQTDTNPHTFL
jgi:hypothetical protein